jgi:hypothetical protein
MGVLAQDRRAACAARLTPALTEIKIATTSARHVNDLATMSCGNSSCRDSRHGQQKLI